MNAPRSLRARVTAAAVVVVVFVLLGTVLAASSMSRRELLDALDRTLDQRADEIAALLDEPTAAMASSDTADRFAQLLAPDGTVVAGTDGLESTPVVDAHEPPGRATRDDLPIEDDTYRVLAVALPDGRTLVVGQNTDDLDDSVRTFTVTLGVIAPIVAGLLGIVIWAVVGRTLAPVESIRREVDAIELDELDRRLHVSGSGDEIDRLATTMNSMLARLEASAERQRRLIADASHELRTPLSRLRLQLETGPGEQDTAGLVAGVDEVQHILDDLLFLAREDARVAPVEHRLVDLDVVIEQEVAAARPATTLVIDTTAVRPAMVRGDQRQLARLVRNLIDNGVRHAATTVVLAADFATGPADGVVRLDVEDDGPGVPGPARSVIFDRFTRIDEARSRTDGGTGLGLAIVREIAESHRGHVHVDDSTLGGARFTVVFPTADAPEQPAPDPIRRRVRPPRRSRRRRRRLGS